MFSSVCEQNRIENKNIHIWLTCKSGGWYDYRLSLRFEKDWMFASSGAWGSYKNICYRYKHILGVCVCVYGLYLYGLIGLRVIMMSLYNLIAIDAISWVS